MLEPSSLLLFSPASFLLPLFACFPALSPAVLSSCLLSTTCILLLPMPSSRRDLPGWLSTLHAHLWCCLSGEMAVPGLDPELCLEDEAARKDGENWTPLRSLASMAIKLWINGLTEKSSPCTFIPRNSHHRLPAASQHLSQPWLSSTAETWKSFTSVRALGHLSFPKHQSFILQ